MNWVVIVGVIIALMFLVSFTTWFFHLFAGVDALAGGGPTRGFKLVTWTFWGLLFMGSIFWGNAMINECPTPEELREGVFVYLDCTVYDYAARKTPLGQYFPEIRETLVIPTPTPEQEAPHYTGEPRLF
jgi:hypothetical protein